MLNSTFQRGARIGADRTRLEVSKGMEISDVMKPDDILTGVLVAKKSKLLKFLAETAAKAACVDEGEVLRALQSRENLGSTGIGSGIAIPHAPVEGLRKPFVLLVRLAKPIEFESIDEEPVDLVCMVLTPCGEQNQYLKLLAKISRQLRSENVRNTISDATDNELIYRTFIDCA